MKICQACDQRFDSSDWVCPGCGHEVGQRDAIALLAPELADAGGGFDPALFAELAELERSNFWFRSRNRLIQWALARYFPKARNFLEVGCGTGFVMSGISTAMPGMRLAGSEVFFEGLRHAAARMPTTELFQMDARHIPFEAEFDVIGAFDVLEHIDDDERVLAEMQKAVRPGGGILLTVPQHRFLWSYRDEHAQHVRRYERADLRAKVEAAGFRVLRTSSFVSLLLPLMYLARRSDAGSRADPLAELRIGGALNKGLEAVLHVEGLMIRAGLSLPFGGSLLMVAESI